MKIMVEWTIYPESCVANLFPFSHASVQLVLESSGVGQCDHFNNLSFFFKISFFFYNRMLSSVILIGTVVLNLLGLACWAMR